MRWGMVVDLSKCVRCHSCISACRNEHFMPMRVTWNKLIAVEGYDHGVPNLMTYSVRCNHCKDAPCVDVCPSSASQKREDGIVWIDQDKCVGCRYCVIACPYQNRTFLSKDKDTGWFPGEGLTAIEKAGKKIYPHQTGTTEKCNFCMERIDSGLKKGLKPGVDRDATPACVNMCPSRALKFGDLDDPESEVSKLIRDRKGFQLHPEYETDPSIYYIDGKVGQYIQKPDPVS
jgi:phenylacetyl-CoA:acceptor oxidoreductase subunit 1